MAAAPCQHSTELSTAIVAATAGAAASGRGRGSRQSEDRLWLSRSGFNQRRRGILPR